MNGKTHRVLSATPECSPLLVLPGSGTRPVLMGMHGRSGGATGAEIWSFQLKSAGARLIGVPEKIFVLVRHQKPSFHPPLNPSQLFGRILQMDAI